MRALSKTFYQNKILAKFQEFTPSDSWNFLFTSEALQKQENLYTLSQYLTTNSPTMRCPKCKNLDTKVIDSRMTEDGQSIRRRRECEKCEARFTTFERLEFINFLVTKSNGEKDLYDRSKVYRSILMAFNKRSMDHNRIEQVINELENEWASNKKGITSKRIGKDILHRLKDIDDVAYIRFASVYHNFDTAQDFVNFIKSELE